MKKLLYGVLAVGLSVAALMATRAGVQAHGSVVGEGLKLVGSNPIRDQSMLTFRINHAMGSVDLSVYDVSGRHVTTLLHGSLSAGEHRVPLVAKDFRVGTYFVRLSTEHGIHKMRVVIEP